MGPGTGTEGRFVWSPGKKQLGYLSSFSHFILYILVYLFHIFFLWVSLTYICIYFCLSVLSFVSSSCVTIWSQTRWIIAIVDRATYRCRYRCRAFSDAKEAFYLFWLARLQSTQNNKKAFNSQRRPRLLWRMRVHRKCNTVPGRRDIPVVKNGTSCWNMILQWGSTLKVSLELPVATRHRRDMTEKLLKATLNLNKQQYQQYG